MRRELIALSVCILFLVSSSPMYGELSPTSHDTFEEPLFDLLMVVDETDETRENFAFYIKDQLRLIGINVEILVRQSFIPFDPTYQNNHFFDLLLTDFEIDHIIPDYQNSYDPDSLIGEFYYYLQDPDFQDFLEADVEVTIPEIQNFVADINSQVTLEAYNDKLREFNELFIQDLVFDIPLFQEKGIHFLRNGYDGYSDVQGYMDLFEAAKLGADWTDESNFHRIANQSTLQLALDNLAWINDLDPYSYESDSFIQFFSEPLVHIDRSANFQPGLAYQWIAENYTRATQDGDETIFLGNQTFFLNQNMKFSPTTISDGNMSYSYPAHMIDGHDIAFTLRYLQTFGNDLPPVFRGLIDFANSVENITVSSFLGTNDRINLLFNSTSIPKFYSLNKLHLLPEHIFNKTLHSSDGNFNFFNTSHHPHQSYEWKNWTSFDNMSLPGLMKVSGYDSNSIQLEARDDYPFPSLFDLHDRIQDFGDDISTQYDLGYFGEWTPHFNENTNYYWTYFDRIDTYTKERPSDSPVKQVYLQHYESNNSVISAFESGSLDSYYTDDPINFHFSSDYITEIEHSNPESHVKMIFNIKNEHLQKRNVRYAIGSVLQIEEYAQNNSLQANLSPLPKYYDNLPTNDIFSGTSSLISWYSEDQYIPYDLETARDLMRLDNDQYPHYNDPTSQTSVEEVHSPSTSDSPFLSFFEINWSILYILPIITLYINKKKKKNQRD